MSDSRDEGFNELNPFYKGATKIEEELRAELYRAQTKTEKYAVIIQDLREKIAELEDKVHRVCDVGMQQVHEIENLRAQLREAREAIHPHPPHL